MFTTARHVRMPASEGGPHLRTERCDGRDRQ
jgi:hypothetical protein